jgi:hypothetical protein
LTKSDITKIFGYNIDAYRVRDKESYIWLVYHGIYIASAGGEKVTLGENSDEVLHSCGCNLIDGFKGNREHRIYDMNKPTDANFLLKDGC